MKPHRVFFDVMSQSPYVSATRAARLLLLAFKIVALNPCWVTGTHDVYDEVISFDDLLGSK